MRRCPVSGTELVRETIHGVEVDRSSEGIWLDKGELYEITKQEGRSIGSVETFFIELKQTFSFSGGRPEERGKAHRDELKCPLCEKVMRADTFRDVELDRCNEHGVWLDDGELSLILERVREDPDFLRGMRLRLEDLQY